MGLVKMASFDLPGAIQYLEKATAADPRFVDAYLYLTRIWLGSENLSRAQKTIARALRLAPHEGTVLSLAGFVRLAYRDYDGAKKLWDAAVKANPRLGEPHLGLAIYQFRHRNYPQGLEEMLTATLLEPRVSLYQSELGKALYQSRSFDRALEVWDYAKTLDPKDPTPYLYKGIALSDLNRPGEAIQEINKSIELNDNVAMFRARQSLDQDRAVRNFNLARAYQQLGLGEWAFSKAVDAFKSDPLNSGAHLFVLSGYLSSGPSFFSPGQLVAARQTENALYRVLSPANQNTYSNLFFGNANLGLTFDYTSMYEMPYARLLAQGGVGAWEGKQFIQDQRGMAYGGMPGAAFAVGGGYFDDQGPGPGARNDQFRQWDVFASAKWSPTVQGVLTGTYSYADQLSGDRGTLADINAVVWPSLRREVRIGSYEIAYLHRFNPKFAVLGYYQYADFPDRTSFRFLDPLFGPGGVFIADDWAFHNAQLQSQFVLGNHTFIGGFDYFYKCLLT
jgi:tetratricopeptide (TPR) repeat protein